MQGSNESTHLHSKPSDSNPPMATFRVSVSVGVGVSVGVVMGIPSALPQCTERFRFTCFSTSGRVRFKAPQNNFTLALTLGSGEKL